MSVKVTVKHKIDSSKWNRISSEIKKLNNAYTAAGLFSDSSNNEGLTLAFIGFINDFGTDDGRIPERPWMRGWVDKNKKKIGDFGKNLYLKVVDGKMTAKKALGILGEFAASGLKKEMTENFKTEPTDTSRSI